MVRAVVLGQEGADAPLHGHVQPDGGLVQEQHLRPVQERHRDLALHPLAQGQIAHRPLQQRRQIEQLGELVQGPPVLRRRHPVDDPVALERVDHRDVPEQLVALAHHQRDAAQEGTLTPGRHVAQHLCPARRGMQQAGEHLQRGGLAGAVGTHEAHELARLQGERDLRHRLDGAGPAPEHAVHGGAQPGLPFGDEVGLGELPDVDREHPPILAGAREDLRVVALAKPLAEQIGVRRSQDAQGLRRHDPAAAGACSVHGRAQRSGRSVPRATDPPRRVAARNR